MQYGTIIFNFSPEGGVEGGITAISRFERNLGTCCGCHVIADCRLYLDSKINTDLNNMTPLQAFDLLRSMKDELGV